MKEFSFLADVMIYIQLFNLAVAYLTQQPFDVLVFLPLILLSIVYFGAIIFCVLRAIFQVFRKYL